MLACLPQVAEAATLTLQWDPNPEPDITGYVLQYGTRPGIYDRSVNVGFATSYTLSLSEPGTTTYYFSVVAYSVTGYSDPSDEIIATVNNPIPRPVVELDYPRAQQVLPSDFVVSGWAADLGAPAGSGVDAIHVYAFPDPGSGKAPVFLGVASYGMPRGDVAAVFGAQFLNSGYSLPVTGLAPALYDIVVYGRSTVAGTFAAQKVVRTRIFSAATAPAPTGEQVAIDVPATGAAIRGAFAVAGWAADLRATTSSGVDRVDVWAYPNPGSGLAPAFLGTAAYGWSRPDVGSIFGARFTQSGYYLGGLTLPAGTYDIAVFARSTVTGGYDRQRVVRVVVLPAVVIEIDTPSPNATLTGGFYIAGWTADLRSTSGSGVDAVHVWAYRAGQAPQFVGAAQLGMPRPDVAAAVGAPFATSGYFVTASGLAPGAYDLVVFARSSLTGVFENAKVVSVVVQ
jgi:hypothetical protein